MSVFLETKRLVLRTPELSDLDKLVALRSDFEVMKYRSDCIELVPYDNQWPQLAEHEIKMLREIMPKKHFIDIQHVGSTAIPGMLAKPIIDIQIAVDKNS